jgi:hypothetical protein
MPAEQLLLLALSVIKELEEGFAFLEENHNNAMNIAHHSNIERAKLQTLKDIIVKMDKGEK